jgi:hypothetical protein
VKRYFGQFHPRRKDRWVFGNRETGAYLPRFGWTKIVRHDLVKGRASPDDPALAGYWAARRRKEQPPPVSAGRLRLLKKQQGRCPSAGTSSCTPTASPRAPQNGSNGPPLPDRGAKAVKRHQTVSGYWHSLGTLARWCRLRSYLDTAAAHGTTALDSIRTAIS